MVRKRPERLPHPKSIPTRPAEPRVAIFDRDPQRCAGVSQIDVVGVFAEACQNTNACVRNDDLKAVHSCGIGSQARVGIAAVTEHIFPEFAHCPDDPCCEWPGKADCDSRLLSTTTPQGPAIGAITFVGVASQWKHASARSERGAANTTGAYCVFDSRRERGFELHRCEGQRHALPRHQHFDQRPDPAGARDAYRTHLRQPSRLRRPEQVIGASEVADHVVTLLPGIDHVLNPRSIETTIVTLNTVSTGCPDRPATRPNSRFPSMTVLGLPAPGNGLAQDTPNLFLQQGRDARLAAFEAANWPSTPFNQPMSRVRDGT